MHRTQPLTTPSELKEQLEAERRSVPFLVFRDGEGEQQIVILDHARDLLSVGRDDECDVRIGWDERVSRLHARLERSGGSWFVHDASFSRNGTFLNGERVNGHRTLTDGDELRFGATGMRFRDTSPKQPSTVASGVALTGPTISPAQRKVLVALCRPYEQRSRWAKPASNRQVATELYLSVDVVKGHLRILFARFGLEDLPQNEKRVRLVQEAFVRDSDL